MPSINKISVRDELDRLKAEFQSQLEKNTQKTDKNSSKPSSQTDKDESALDHKGSKGKGKKEQDESAYNTRTTETTTLSEVTVCGVCGEDLSTVPCLTHERRTKIDILFEKVVEHVDAEMKTCPICNSQVKGAFPTDMAGALQYGNGLKAYVINLLVCQRVALNRVQKSVKAMISQTLSEATLLKFVMRLHDALASWEQSAIDELLTLPAMHVDETSLRVEKKNHWIHVYAAGDITLKRLHRR